MIDLSTNYLGLKLSHPLVPSASPLSESIDGIRRLEDAGADVVTGPLAPDERVVDVVVDRYRAAVDLARGTAGPVA